MFRKKQTQPARPFCSAVVVAAGSGTRMGTDKLMLQLGGCTVIERTLAALDRSECIDEIVVVTQSEKISTIAALARERGIAKLKCVTEGGADRTASAWAGVQECSEQAGLIAIHDAARPLVTEEIIERAVTAAELSRQTGIDAGILRKIMTGRETAVSTRNLMTLARYFGLSMQELIDAFSGQ